MSSITTLPPELLMEIFSYLPLQELLDNIQQVCCAWRKLVRHPSLWEHFVYSADPDTKVEEVVGFINKCPMLKHIHACYLNTSTAGPQDLITAVVENCSDICSFCVTFFGACLTISQVDALFEAFPNLISLDIEVEHQTTYLDRVSKCNKLKKLTVRGEHYCDGLFKPLIDGCISLEYLHIGIANIPEKDHVYILEKMKDRLLCVEFSDSQPASQEVVNVFGAFTKLQELTLEYTLLNSGHVNYLPLASIRTLKCFTFYFGCPEMSSLDTLLEALFRDPFPLLENLSISIYFLCERIILKDICQCYPNLKSLYLLRTHSYFKDTFEYVGKLQRLKSLTYPISTTITDEDTEQIAQCRSLKHLNLYQCRGLSDRTIVHLGNCKSLESFYCHSSLLSKQSLRLISEHLQHLKLLHIFGIGAKKLDTSVLTERMPLLKIFCY